MARKQNKAVKTTKKDSSLNINTRKGGRVVKKLADSKSKKKIESQLKQTTKLQEKTNRNQVKQVSPANTGRRSGRFNNSDNNKFSTPSSQRTNTTKVSTPKKTSSPSSSGKVQRAGKRKSNSLEQPEHKRHGSTTNSQKFNKHDNSQSDKKKLENKMSLRGKKRSYTQLASGNKVDGNNVTKKRKTVSTKDVTSRGSRSIKPTVKGSEWRNTILQKKSVGTKQEKSDKKSGKSPIKGKPSIAASKSPKQNKNALPPKSSGPNRSGIKTSSKKSPPKRQSGGRLPVQKIEKLSPSKGKVKNPTKIDTIPNKSPRLKSKSRKSDKKPGGKEKTSSEVNSLATSIKDKFTSCVSNKRKLRGSDLQENVIVAQGILHDILNSVGTSDVLPTEEKPEYKENLNSAASDSHILPIKVFDQNELCVNKEEVSAQITDIAASATKLHSVLMEEKVVSDIGSATVELRTKTNDHILDEMISDPIKSNNLDIANDVLDVQQEISENEEGNCSLIKSNEDETVEMELCLLDSSSASLNDSEIVSTDIKTNVEVDGCLVSEGKEKVKDEQMEKTEPMHEEKTVCVNGDNFQSDYVNVDTPNTSNKVFVHVDSTKEDFSQMESEKKEFTKSKNVSYIELENPHDVSDVISEKPSCLSGVQSTFKKSVEKEEPVIRVKPDEIEGVKTLISNEEESLKDGTSMNEVTKNKQKIDGTNINKKGESTEPIVNISQNKNESNNADTNCIQSNHVQGEHDKIKEIPSTHLNNEASKTGDCVNDKNKSDDDLHFVENQDAFNNDNITVLDKKITVIPPGKESPCFINSHSTFLDKAQKKHVDGTNIDQSEIKNNKHNIFTRNGSEGDPSVLSPQKNDEVAVDNSPKAQVSTNPGNEDSLNIKGNKELKSNDVFVDEVDVNVVKNSDGLQLNVKEDSDFHSTANLNSTKELKHCPENKEVNIKEASHQVETTQNPETNELNIQEIVVEKSRQSEKLAEDSSILSKYDDASTKVSPDIQRIEKLVPEEKVLEKQTIVSSNCAIFPDSSEQIYNRSKQDISEEISSFKSNSDKSEVTSDPAVGKDAATDLQKEIPLKSSSSTVVENDPSLDERGNTEELNQLSSSTSDKTDDDNKAGVGSTITSSDVERLSVDEHHRIPKVIQQDSKTDNSTNLTEDISKVTLVCPDSLSCVEQISVDENKSTSESGQSDVNLTLETSLEGSKSSHCTEGLLSCSIEITADKVKDSKIGEAVNKSEEVTKMEETNQEETTQDSIIVDDADGESMQCNSETLSSNRMSVDEENLVMEVDSDEVTAVASACSPSETKVDGEMNMEVS